MNLEERRKLFCENFRLLKKNIHWFKKSLEKTKQIKDIKNVNEEQLGTMEVLASRYSRSIDILINKLLRSLDYLEFEDISRKLDIIIRAEKRGFVKDFNILIEMKDLRNELAHEYIEENFKEKVKEIIEKSKELIEIINKIEDYVKNYKYC